MRHVSLVTACAAALALAGAAPAAAQSWSGPYIGAAIGAALQRDDAAETVTFDTNLDGTFDEIVRTAAGADAFSPGFCAGLALGAGPNAGCTEDDKGLDVSARLGYDWQLGRVVIGGVVDVTRVDVTDGVSAFSTTPAFYAFSRQVNVVGGVRGRVGVGNERLLIYGTGGSAWGRIDHVFTSSNAVNTFAPGKGETRSDMSWGYQAGGGIEVRVGARWSLTGEYLFTSLNDRTDSTVRSQGPAPATNPFILVNSGGTDLQRSDRFDMHVVRAGLSYRF